MNVESTHTNQVSEDSSSHDPSIYLCGNSLGVQPRLVATRIQQYLTTWSTQGVFAHFKTLAEAPFEPLLHFDSDASKRMAPVVGARPAEVAIMQTLTANLHLLMSAFYRPDPKGRYKIIIEGKAFPSDHVRSSPLRTHASLSDWRSLQWNLRYDIIT